MTLPPLITPGLEGNSQSTPNQAELPFGAQAVSQLFSRVLEPVDSPARPQAPVVNLSALSPQDRSRLQSVWGRAGLRNLQALSQETDESLLAADLMALGRELDDQGHQDGALLCLHYVQELGESSVHPSVRRIAQEAGEAIAVIRGEGPLGIQLEHYSRHFFQEAFHPATLGGMALGQLAFAPLRHGALRLLWRPESGRFALGALGARVTATSVGLAGEVPIFWGGSKLIQSQLTPGQVSWEGPAAWRELGGLALTLGALRLAGFGSRTALQWAQGGRSQVGWGLRAAQRTLPATGAIGALYFSHGLQESLGWREASSPGARLLDSTVVYFQFGLTGRLAHHMLGPRFHHWNQEWNQRLEQQLQGPPRPPGLGLSSWGGRIPAFAGGVPAEALGARSEMGPKFRPITVMHMEGEAQGGGPLTRVEPLIQRVIERGTPGEIQSLKDILLEVYRSTHGRDPSERLLRKIQSSDPEEWKIALGIMATGNRDAQLRFRSALTISPAYLEFVSRWDSRPHFLHGREVPLHTTSGVTLKVHERRILDRLTQRIAQESSLKGMREFMGEFRGTRRGGKSKGKDPMVDFKGLETQSGERHYVGNIGGMGIHVRFDGEGIFRGPIRLYPPFIESKLGEVRERVSLDKPLDASLWEVPKTLEASPLSPADITVEFVEGTRRNYSFGQTLRRVQEMLAADPSSAGARKIFESFSAKNDAFEIKEHSNGSVSVVMNRGPLGLVLRFDPQGQLVLPLSVAGKFKKAQFQTLLDQQEPVEIQEAPSPGEPSSSAPVSLQGAGTPLSAFANSLLPKSREEPIEYAIRLMAAGKNPDEQVQLQLVQALEAGLENPQSRDLVLASLERMESLSSLTTDPHQAVVRSYELPGLQRPLKIFSPITTFLPEDWSLFFAQKVSEYIESNGGGRERVAELGSGTGWLSLYLKARGLASYVEGGDRTPTAPVVSRINAHFNGVDSVRFVQSNLWQGMSQETPFDLVVACIPQIPQVAELISQRGFADYAPQRDNVMRPFGLGLIHDALEQSLTRLNPQGRILLNLAGRPGLTTLLEMYRRTGYHPIVRDSEVILQDPSTDISPLAALESRFPGVRFEFLPPEGSDPDVTLSAREAVDLRDRQGVQGIRHRQFLIEGAPYHGIWQQLMKGGQGLPAEHRWAYTSEPGRELAPLREALSRHLGRDWGMDIDPEVIFIAPNTSVLAEGILRLRLENQSQLAWVGEVPESFGPLRSQLREYGHHDEAWEPEALAQKAMAGEIHGAVVFPPPLSWHEASGLRRLMDVFSDQHLPLVVIDPFGGRAGSQEGGVLEALVQNPRMAANTYILQDLQARWQGTIPLGAGFIRDPEFYRSLSRYGDLTYSRTSAPAQQLYLRFLSELDQLDFNLVGGLMQPNLRLEPLSASVTPLVDFMRPVLRMPGAFGMENRSSRLSPVIDMSFGESEWKAPVDLSAAWEWSYQQREAPQEMDHNARLSIEAYLKESRAMEVDPEQIVLGYGVHSLIYSTMRSLGQRGGLPLQVWVPSGSYGMFYPTVAASGAKLRSLETQSGEDFLVNPETLEKALSAPQVVPAARSALLINVPTNPAGRYYSPEHLAELNEVLARHDGILLFDDIFGLLHHHNIPVEPQAYASRVWEGMGENGIFFGGLSKEFGAGGLRLGWALSRNPEWLRGISQQRSPEPDTLAMSAAPRLLQRWRAVLPQHQNYLVANRRLLTELLEERHIPYHVPEGGFSLLVDFNPFFRQGRQLRRADGRQVSLTARNFPNLLYEEAGLKINSDQWSHTPGRYRFVFSIDNMELATKRLRRFLRSTR